MPKFDPRDRVEVLAGASPELVGRRGVVTDQSTDIGGLFLVLMDLGRVVPIWGYGLRRMSLLELVAEAACDH